MSDPSPLSSPIHDNTIPMEVVSTQAAPTPSLPATPPVARAAQIEISPAIATLKIALGGLRDKLSELPLLQVAVDILLECVTDLQVDEYNRQEYDDLASDLTNLVTELERRTVEPKPHDGACSIGNVVRAICEHAQLIKTQQERSRIFRLTMANDDDEPVLKLYREIAALFQQLQNDLQLSMWGDSNVRDMDIRLRDLCPTHDACYDAAIPTSVTKRVKCTNGTRVELLEIIQSWARDENATKIFWLNGMAGTGKTTIAYTLCEILQKARQLGASFFCSRDSPDCRDVHRIVPTIAYQLGRYSNLFRQALCAALKSDPDASKRSISTQFEHLIAKPCAKIGQALPKDVVVVIDALDECTDEAGTKDVLNTLIQHAVSIPIRFFVASRPEPAIFKSMTAPDGALRSIFWLHDIEKSLVQADIKLYLTEALASIDVSSSEIDQLAARAGNLFIFAATTVRYILPDRGVVNQRHRLQVVLKLQPSQKHRSYQDIDNLYAAILASAFDKDVYEEEEITARQQVLKTVVCAMEPLTIPALAEILRTSDEDVEIAIQPLQSLLDVSVTTNAVSALHASFPDFVLSRERAGQFYCDKVLHSSYLAGCCFGLMGWSLKFNICGLESSHMLDKDVPNLPSRVDKAISPGVFYSCRYWSNHLTSGPPSSTLFLLLDQFLQQHLLFWMEVLHLKGGIGHGEDALGLTLAWLPIERELTQLRDFLYDARNFLTLFAGNPTSLSTPHIYISVLPFTPKESRVWTTYWKRTRGLIQIEGAIADARSKSALATWVIGDPISTIAQSSDGRRVASGSEKDEVNVWDVSSGTRVLGPLRGHNGRVRSVTFSPDSSRIASGSQTCTICVWDAHNGNLVVGPLCGHTSYVTSVAFSSHFSNRSKNLRDNIVAKEGENLRYIANKRRQKKSQKSR